MTVMVMKGEQPVEVLPDGSKILLSFTIPETLQQESFSIVYWDAKVEDGTGGWVAQEIPVLNGRAEITVNFTGMFFLISE